MNKIQELAAQAKASVPQGILGVDKWIETYNQIFAELIVQESCNEIERRYKYELGEKTQWAMSQDVQDLLKTHFGVEDGN